MAESNVPAPPTTVSGPAKISFALQSLRGPLARLRALSLPAKRIAFVNTGRTAVPIAHISADPVQEEQHGAVAGDGSLHLDVAGPMVADIGAPLVVTVTGTAPARPGTYLSTLRVHPEAGPPIAVPVSISVAASSAWGVGLTLLGLSVVNLLAGLDAQGAVATKLQEALHKRGEAQIFVAHYPEPDGRGDVAAMDRAYEAAITALSRPRSAGLLDHRLEDAAAPLAEADGLVALMRKNAAASPSDALVATADIPWNALKPQLQALTIPMATGVPGAAVQPAAGDGSTDRFGSGLDAVLARLQERLVGAPARWLGNELAAQVTRLKLIAASGEIEDARTQARAVQAAMRRAAHSVASAQRIVMRQAAQNGFLLGTVQEIRRGMSEPDIAAQSRAEITAKLDSAQVLLSEGTEFRRMVDVNRTVNAAETDLTRAAAQAMQTKAAAAIAAASAETDIPEVDQAAAAGQADPDKSPASKTAHLRAIVDAWRSTIAQARDPSARPALLTHADAIAAALDRGDMPGVSTSYRALTTAWAAYGGQRVAAAAAQVLKPYCDDYAAKLQRRLGFIDQDLHWEEPNARSIEWDRRRDRLRLALERVAPGPDCLKVVLDLDKDAMALTAEIGAAAADTAGIDAAVRLEALAIYGVATSTGPRALTPYTDTPAAELLVDRPLRISIGNLDPAWGVGTTVLIGFGDGSPPVSIDAEKLRQSAAEHIYTRPLSAHVTVLAADAFTPDGQAVGTTLGEGTATLLIVPAPDSQARIVADRFLSARFGLALIVALVIYSWRFLARDRVFGARGFDYAEAFLLGFTINAAIAELPAVLAKLPLG